VVSGTPEPSLVEIKTTDSGVYEVYRCASEAEALAFLRRRDVPQERYYLIVETPVRNLGRDLIGIFDEDTSAQIEFPGRTPLREPLPSRTNCARCGYVVVPAKEIESFTSGPFTMSSYSTLDEMIEHGGGFRCTGCSSLACASCYRSTGNLTVHSDGAIATDAAGRLRLRCWVCDGAVDVFRA
jgi:hypothetical protein